MNSTYTALIALLRAGGIRPFTETLTSGEAESTQFSVRLRPETRMFFDACAERMGISRAAMFGLLADGVIAEVRDDTADRAVTLYERFCLLLDAHNLDVVAQARLLKPWGFRTSVLASRERTLDLLEMPLLQQLADWFHVDVDWLRGTSPSPVRTGEADADGISRWAMLAEDVRRLPETTGPAEMIFCFSRRGREPVREVGLCLRYRRIIQDVPVPAVIWYGTAVWGEADTQEVYRQLQSRISVSSTGHPVRPPQETYPQVRGRYFRLTARQMQGLSRGEILPVMALNNPQGQYPGI
ncbi:hypothetical protein ACE3YX_005025 [Salmonella enterica]